MQSPRRITVFDTTLRDGEQSVGVAFTADQKVELALALERLGVDVVEAGFPVASPGELEGVRAVAEAVRGPIVAGMARAHELDVEAAAEALAPARRSRLHVVLGTSPIHRERKLGLTRTEVIDRAASVIRLARPLFDEVEFCCEDASRTEPEFLAEVCAAVIGAGADVLNIPDTVGYAVPEEYGRLFAGLATARAPLSAHCHDDLGLAVANTLAAVESGAAQVECTVNGIGERAGNAALEEVVTALAREGYATGVDLDRLQAVSTLVARLSGYPLAPHKAVIGTQTLRSAARRGSPSPDRPDRPPAERLVGRPRAEIDR
jgi:2-isopropylmalate synthase